jgi:hypothetical protein
VRGERDPFSTQAPWDATLARLSSSQATVGAARAALAARAPGRAPVQGGGGGLLYLGPLVRFLGVPLSPSWGHWSPSWGYPCPFRH